MLATDNESYLKSCRYSQEHPYCPIFVLGNIVRWAGGDFQEMASQVGVPWGSWVLPAGSLGACESHCPASCLLHCTAEVPVLKVKLVPFILSPGNGGSLKQLVGSVIFYSGVLLFKLLLCQQGFFV